LVRARRTRKPGRLPRAKYSITARGLAVLTESELRQTTLRINAAAP
jgi:hypothetical protein